MTTRSFEAIAALVGCALILAIRTASAQEQASALPVAPTSSESPQADATLQEIIVTARKREENIMTVPVSVQTFSDTEIADTDVKDMQTLSEFTPGLTAGTEGATGGVGKADRSTVVLTFRGLSTDPGSVFIDGAPYTGNGMPDVTDIKRVEVLNGPQSVYFGRSTFSGAINFVTETPSDVFKGEASQDLSTYNGVDSKLTLEGPVIGADLLNARISLRRSTFGGQYVDGVDSDINLGAQSTSSASLALASSPIHNLSLSAYVSYQLDEDGPPPAASLGPVGPGAAFNCNLGGTGGPYYCGALPTLSGISPSTIGEDDKLTPLMISELVDNSRGVPVPFSTDWLTHFGLKRQILHEHLNADFTTDSGWDVAAQYAANSTKYANLQGVEGRDTSNIPNPLYPATPAALAAACAAGQTTCFAPQNVELTIYGQSLTRDYSTELRLSTPQNQRLRGMIGASYYNVGGPIASNQGIQDSGALLNGGGGGLKSAVSTPAVFGGVYFDLTRALTLVGEMRYQWDGVTQQQLFPVASEQLHQVFTSFSPRVTAQYKLTPDSMLYATWSRGYKPGGFNPGLIGLSASALAQFSGLGTDLTYQQELIDNFEIGHKATWLDNRLRTTLALYYMTWTNGQVSNGVFFTQPNGSTASVTVTQNVGKVDLMGAELAVEFAATRNLTLAGTLDYAGNKIIDYVYNPNGLYIQNSTNVNGNSLPETPKLKLSFSPTYRGELSKEWGWYTRGDYYYQSKEYSDPTDSSWISARGLVYAHLGLTKGSNFKAEMYVNNLFNNTTLLDTEKTSQSYLGPSLPCPPCYTAASPPVITGGVTHLNAIFLGLPVLRTVGIRGSYDF